MADVDAATSRRHRLTLRSHGSDTFPDTTATTITIVGDLNQHDLDRLARVLVDPLLEVGAWDAPVGVDQLDIGLIPGVTDTAAAQVVHAADLLGVAITDASVGRLIDLDADDTAPDDAEIRGRWANAVIERWSLGTSVEPGFAAGSAVDAHTERIELPADDAALTQLGKARGLALDLAELHVIREHFAAIGRLPTDAELETLAQTWSEHCAHKSFRADVVQSDDESGNASEPLLARLRRSTTEIAAPFVVSAFDGNAGIVKFGPDRTYALKCETHNHPSAIEPFGGANTGVGGVIRDIIGAHHRAIACTNILC
ncbi:MAG: purS, partial [Ilumatobacteraceae bacterium]|nr:purS [Ilumatobacteraceae bacterium]